MSPSSPELAREKLQHRMEKELDMFTMGWSWHAFKKALENGEMHKLDELQFNAIQNTATPKTAKLWTAIAAMAVANDPSDVRHEAAAKWVGKQRIKPDDVLILLRKATRDFGELAVGAIGWLSQNAPTGPDALRPFFCDQVLSDYPPQAVLERLLTAFGDRCPMAENAKGEPSLYVDVVLDRPGFSTPHVWAMQRCWSDATKTSIMDRLADEFHSNAPPPAERALRLLAPLGWASPNALRRILEGQVKSPERNNAPRLEDDAGRPLASLPVAHSLSLCSRWVVSTHVEGLPLPWAVEVLRLARDTGFDATRPYAVPVVENGARYTCALESAMRGTSEFFMEMAKQQQVKTPASDWLSITTDLISKADLLIGQADSDSERRQDILTSLHAFQAKAQVDALMGDFQSPEVAKP